MFHQRGLKSLWMRLGLGNTIRYVPIHTLAERHKEICDVLPAIHTLTGCDVTSKFGTKQAALKANPTKYLEQFGKITGDLNTEIIIRQAEQYLVKVLKHGSSCTTVDELLYAIYHQNQTTLISELPPTSFATEEHILRAFYATHLQINCLMNLDVSPELYGYVKDDNLLVPKRLIRLLPDDLIECCNCARCTTKRCICRENSIPCCAFCKCLRNNDAEMCSNPYNSHT